MSELPEILQQVEISIQNNEAKIRALSEYVRSTKGGDYYGAFPITHITELPHGADPGVIADNLSASYPNEALSLADLIDLGLDPDNDFTKAAATGFQYKSKAGPGYFVVWEVEVEGTTYERSINYGPEANDAMFEHDWRIKSSEQDLEFI